MLFRSPKVQEAVKQFFGKEPHKGVNPDEVVAIGGWLLADKLAPSLAESAARPDLVGVYVGALLMWLPLYVLRVPVRYYRSPPAYFRGWRAEAPPRWGDHWGNDWQQRRGHHAAVERAGPGQLGQRHLLQVRQARETRTRSVRFLWQR